MNKRKMITGAVVALVVAVLVGLLIARLQKRPITQLEDAKTVYINAADAAKDIHDYVLEVSQTHQFTANGKTYTENANYLLSCEGFASDNMKVCKEETLTIGKHTAKSSEIFTNDTVYIAMNDAKFSGAVASADYLQKITPIVLLDYTLYHSFSGVDSGAEYVIHITDPTEPETWAFSEDMIFIGASGTAYVSYAGKLTKSIYILEYTKGNVTHRLTYTSQLTEKTPEITVPENAENYTPIQYLEGIKMLEHASGLLTQANNIRSESKETSYFEAFGDTRTKTVILETQQNVDWSAKVATETVLSNASRPDQDSVYKQNETFKLGVYQREMTGINDTQNLDISEEEMQTYCLNLLVSTIMLPKDVLQCQKEENNGVIRITYTASKDFARQISQNACDALYQNPDLLTELSQKVIMDETVAYLELDANTYLPLASGIHYSSTYSAEGLPYQFRYTADQTYQISN